MKAILAMRPGGPDVLEDRDVPIPEIAPDEILVRTRLAAVNFADVYSRRGASRDAPPFPVVPGIEVLGTVVEVGDSVREPGIGQRIVALVDGGGYAEFARVSARSAVAVPDELVDERAAGSMIVGLTAYHLLVTTASARAGTSVLITAAAGGVGIACVRLAAKLGLEPIVAAVITRHRAEVAGSCGATSGTPASSRSSGSGR